MFKEYLVQKMSLQYEAKLMLFDYEGIIKRYNYVALLLDYNFEIKHYNDVTEFRFFYETEVKGSDKKFAVIVENSLYIPYDILHGFYRVDLSWVSLFPKLNSAVLIKEKRLDLALLYGAYKDLYEEITNEKKTRTFITEKVFAKENAEKYISALESELKKYIASNSLGYQDWFYVADKKRKAECLAARCNIAVDFSFVDEKFKSFVFQQYQNLSSVIKTDSPLIVSRVMEHILRDKDKVALVVMDGMSLFDFEIIASTFTDIEYEERYIFAMIPTTTAISRQSLLSGKFPVELDKPFELSREEKEFIVQAKDAGYSERQICYTRGYYPQVGQSIKCLSVIINDIDDLVHGQKQGRCGMYNNIKLLAESGKIQKLLKQLDAMGFCIYLTSDHGNTLCNGLGNVKGMGVEVATKAKRMLILKEFANESELVAKYGLVAYPGYYLDKQYKYYVCDTGTSFDVKDTVVMTHGGISIEEVIVPFIKIKAVHDG